MKNLILRTDSYKASHFYQYPPGTSSLFAYLESRGGRYGRTVWFGLQYLLKEYLSQRVTVEDVEQAAAFWASHGEPFPKDGWMKIATVHGGKLPLLIRAVPEGSVVPTHNVLMTVESTDPQLPWLVTWVETLLERVWYPTTVATLSWHCKRKIREFLVKTSNDPDGELLFKLHDFGGRGVSSAESAGIGGAAHLVNFRGSDTVEGVLCAEEYYGTCETRAGYSIPAMEHSTVTSWGRDGEIAAFRNMIERSEGSPMVACVSDSYDIDNAVEKIWCDDLRDLVIKSGKTVVIRPDSGDPSEVNVRLLQILDRKLGMGINTKGYKVLPSYFRLIQGDGNDDEDSIAKVLQAVTSAGFSATNIAFGMGGGLLQKVNRDTQRFAYKVSRAVIDGKPRDVFKAPKGDMGKASKGGRLDLRRLTNGAYETHVLQDALPGIPGPYPTDSELVMVFHNGAITKTWTLDEVRARADKELGR